MRTTIFYTPVVNTLMRVCSRVILRLTGWKVTGLTPEQLADYPKYVLIAAPHTSNWDFPFTLMVCFVLRIRVYWMAKASLFTFPIGILSRWLGGISVERSATNNTVQTTVDAFAARERLVVLVAPEGTRGKVTHWKTGFYHIAQNAGVPIALAYLDFKKRTGGVGRMFTLTGDMEADMLEIQRFYSGVTGKNSTQFNAAGVRSLDQPDS
jgi:1-acyl-sn-glycerol-3-phosphate acyltransferase